MRTIILQISDSKDAEMIALAKRLNLRILKNSDDKLLERFQRALKIMSQIAEMGTIRELILDPVARHIAQSGNELIVYWFRLIFAM
ncbi:MAG: hypothetical protein EBS19_15090 [Spirochaetia bacterium]|nr:hypothetical protein [Spirochaetia bacterium]